MKNKTCLILTATCIALVGCTITKYESPHGEKFSRVSFGSKTGIGELSLSGDTNGVRTITLKGYQSDGVAAIGVAVDAAVSAAVKSVKP